MSLATLQERIDTKTMNLGTRYCWPWLGHISKLGEARVWVDVERGSISVPAALRLLTGKPVPEGQYVLCCPVLKDCVNPRHHSLARLTEVGDRILWKRGLQRQQRETTMSDEEIRQAYLSTESGSALARRYGVSRSQISNIRAGRRHRRLTENLTPPIRTASGGH